MRIHVSLIMAFLLIAGTLVAGYLPDQYPGLSTAAYWIIGILSAASLFISVLIHELSHSIVAIRNGLPVARIVLFIFGGVSEIKDEPRTPKLELAVSLAGPLSSLALGLIFTSLWYASSLLPVTRIVPAVLQYSGYVNFILGGFNLIPAFPLDGGRILRASIWKRTGEFYKSTVVASRVGVVFSYGFMFMGILIAAGGAWISGLWLLFIGWFLKSGADSHLAQARIAEFLTGLKISEIMTSPVVCVESHLSLQRLVDNYILKYKHLGFPVVQDGKLIGIVTLQDAKSIPRERWDEVGVEEVMTPKERLITAKPGDDAADALMKMAQRQIGRLPVVDDEGRVVGIVTRSDLTKKLTLRDRLSK